MKIYEFDVREGYEWVVPLNDSDFEVFRCFDGPALAPAALGFLYDNSGQTIAFLAMGAAMVAAATLVLAATGSRPQGARPG